MSEDHDSRETPGQAPGSAGDAAALERLSALWDDTVAEQGPDPEPSQTLLHHVSTRSPPVVSEAPRGRVAARGGGRLAVRIAAPVVFLAAVLIFVVILFQSGVMGSGSEMAASPSPKASAAASVKPKAAAGDTKKYVVKSGDTLSAIADRFDTTTKVLQDLNPKVSSSTLAVGAKIKVPRN